MTNLRTKGRTTLPSDALVARARGEYLEMPGLQLTKAQVRRLWGLEDNTCEAVLEQLEAIHFLRRTAGDLYVLDGLSC